MSSLEDRVMNYNLQKFFENLIPFLVIGIAIALFVGLLFMFFYVAIWGILLGSVLYLIVLAKNFFFPKKPAIKEKGRVIEHDDK